MQPYLLEEDIMVENPIVWNLALEEQTLGPGPRDTRRQNKKEKKPHGKEIPEKKTKKTKNKARAKVKRGDPTFCTQHVGMGMQGIIVARCIDHRFFE